jgi:hypothetical protein
MCGLVWTAIDCWSEQLPSNDANYNTNEGK